MAVGEERKNRADAEDQERLRPAPALAGRQAANPQGEQAEIQKPGQAQERQRSPFTDLRPSHGGRAEQEFEATSDRRG